MILTTGLFLIITFIAVASLAYGLVYKLGAKISALVPHKLIKGTRGPEGLVALSALAGRDGEINETVKKLNLSKDVTWYRYAFLAVALLAMVTFVLILKLVNL